MAFLAGSKSYLAENTAMLSGHYIHLAAGGFRSQGGAKTSKNLLAEFSIKFLTLSAKYFRKSHVKVGKDLCVQILQAELERRGH